MKKAKTQDMHDEMTVKNGTAILMRKPSNEDMKVARCCAQWAVAESQALEREYTIAVQCIQNGIKNCLELAKLCKVTNQNDAICVKINNLIMEEETLTKQWISNHGTLQKKRRGYEQVCENGHLMFKDGMCNQKATTDNNNIQELSQTSETLADEYEESANV
ncbi:hypothetical protein MHU86_2979 [Fragilaria crotonensis]|nr:hypothetical protein MHU86_2979 [Fragilaria crotonensis]